MGQPFSRFNALMAAVAGMMATSTVSMAAAVAQLGGYKSRGHGVKTRMPSGTQGGSIGAGNRCNPPGRYPEQSQRQALRRYRRAQGGPGLAEGPNPGPMHADAHRAYAAKLFNVPERDVTAAQRRYAKTVRYVDLYSTQGRAR